MATGVDWNKDPFAGLSCSVPCSSVVQNLTWDIAFSDIGSSFVYMKEHECDENNSSVPYLDVCCCSFMNLSFLLLVRKDTYSFNFVYCIFL